MTTNIKMFKLKISTKQNTEHDTQKQQRRNMKGEWWCPLPEEAWRAWELKLHFKPNLCGTKAAGRQER